MDDFDFEFPFDLGDALDIADFGIDLGSSFGACFGNDCNVERFANDKVEVTTVDSVKPGDRIRTREGFERVVYVHKVRGTQRVIRIAFRVDGNGVFQDGHEGLVSLTPYHLIFTADDCTKEACKLQIGDSIQVRGGTATITSLTGGTCGVRSLITTNGELFVEGARLSSYAHSERLHNLTRAVSWTRCIQPSIPHHLCKVCSPAMSNWVLPTVMKDCRERKKLIKAATVAQKQLQTRTK